jgi:hypothetical protein
VSILSRFRKKEQKESVEKETSMPLTELEQLCGDDKETYEALVNTMFLDPRKIGISMKEAAENAEKFEKTEDLLRARTLYEIAGGLAIYEGNVEKVVEFYSECERLSPDKKYPILKNPEKAVAKAQEYYQKYLKT